MPSEQPGVIRGQRRNSSQRLMNERRTPIGVTSWSAAGTDLTVEYDQPVVVKGVPQYVTDVAGAVAVSATASGPNTVVITFDADISLAAEITIPFQDLSVRNVMGGYVAPLSIAA